MDRLDWNDLRYVVAVAEGGSAAAAARALGVSHATVLRRVQALEQHLGAPLFHRLPTGYEATEEGQALAALGATVQSAVAGARRSIESRSRALAGTIRFTTTDSFAADLVPPLLAAFHARHPDTHVELVGTAVPLDLGAREADVALRATFQPPPHWVGSRIADLSLGAYAAPGMGGPASALHALPWVVPGGALQLPSLARWLDACVPPERRVMSADSFLVLRALALAGVGATVLPDLLAGGLQRLQDLPTDASPGLWLLMHPESRRTRRVAAFVRFMGDALRATHSRPPAPRGRTHA